MKKEESVGDTKKEIDEVMQRICPENIRPLSSCPNLSYLSNLPGSQFYHSDNESLNDF